MSSGALASQLPTVRKQSWSQLQLASDSGGAEASGADYDPKGSKKGMIRRHWLKAAALLALLAPLAVWSNAARVGAAQPGAGPPQELYNCINDGHPATQLTTYRDFAYQKPAR